MDSLDSQTFYMLTYCDVQTISAIIKDEERQLIN